MYQKIFYKRKKNVILFKRFIDKIIKKNSIKIKNMNIVTKIPFLILVFVSLGNTNVQSKPSKNLPERIETGTFSGSKQWLEKQINKIKKQKT